MYHVNQLVKLPLICKAEEVHQVPFKYDFLLLIYIANNNDLVISSIVMSRSCNIKMEYRERSWAAQNEHRICATDRQQETSGYVQGETYHGSWVLYVGIHYQPISIFTQEIRTMERRTVQNQKISFCQALFSQQYYRYRPSHVQHERTVTMKYLSTFFDYSKGNRIHNKQNCNLLQNNHITSIKPDQKRWNILNTQIRCLLCTTCSSAHLAEDSTRSGLSHLIRPGRNGHHWHTSHKLVD